MIRFAAPGFLLAGALLALVPLALHLLARTPPERRPLPTARFLSPDRRTRLRLHRPSDLLLLALRALLLVLLGAAFARPAWVARPGGHAVIVLLDAGLGMNGAWQEALETAGERLAGGGRLVVFDSAARVHDNGPAALDSLRAAGPSAARSSYLAALRGLRAAARVVVADSATAVLVTRPRWGAWSPAVPAVRSAAWPARIELAEVGAAAGEAAAGREPAASAADGAAAAVPPQPPPGDRGAASGDPSAVGAGSDTIRIEGPPDHPLRPYVVAALRALGYAASAEGSGGAAVLLGGAAPPPGVDRLVALGGEPAAFGTANPWQATDGASGAGVLPDAAGARWRGRLVTSGGFALSGWRPLPGTAASAARVVVVWEDGSTAAAASPEGRCVSYLAAEPADPLAAADPAFPRLLDALLAACRTAARDEGTRIQDQELADAPLDRGARAWLSGGGLPDVAEVSSVVEREGRPLTRILFTLALLLAATETVLAYRRRGRPA